MKYFRYQNVTIFSNGSSILDLDINIKSKDKIKILNKDLKHFQKMFKAKSSSSFLNFSNSTSKITTFRKKLFK